jgi:hypothetical protein
MRCTVAAPADPYQTEEDQRPLTPPGQAKAWFQLLLAMTIPALFLLIGISLIR